MFTFYAPIFRRDVLWYRHVRPSGVSPSGSSAVFFNTAWPIKLKFGQWLCLHERQFEFQNGLDLSIFGRVMGLWNFKNALFFKTHLRAYSVSFTILLFSILISGSWWLTAGDDVKCFIFCFVLFSTVLLLNYEKYLNIVWYWRTELCRVSWRHSTRRYNLAWPKR